MPLPSCEFQPPHKIIASAPPLSLPVLASCTLCRRSRRDTHVVQWTVGSCDVLCSWQEHIYYLLACGDVRCDVEILRIISAFGHLREYSVLLAWKMFYIGMCNDWTNRNVKQKICTAFNIDRWSTAIQCLKHSTGALKTDILCCTLTTKAVINSFVSVISHEGLNFMLFTSGFRCFQVSF